MKRFRSISRVLGRSGHRTGRRGCIGELGGLLIGLGLAAWMGCASSADPERVLRVGTSGDYAPFSEVRGPAASSSWSESLQGFDPAVARAYAADRNLRIEWVRFSWPELLKDLEAGRFDIAMSGVTVRPERSIAGRFSVPVAQSGAVVLTRLRPGGVVPTSLHQIDQPGLRIAVNQGGHLERVARRHLTRATVVAIDDNDAVREGLLAGDFDAAVTDTLEAPHWSAAGRDLVSIGPFTHDRKAYLARPDLPELSRDLDRWLLGRELDGSLAALRLRHLGSSPGNGELSPALLSLLASIDERLALMPWVADAKRRSGSPVEAPEREEQVLRAAVSSAQRTAEASGRRAKSPAALRALFRAQIEAAKQIQRRRLAGPPAPEPGSASLRDELRPALIRIGDRIAALTAELPREVNRDAVRAATAQALSQRDLDEAHVNAIADAVLGLIED